MAEAEGFATVLGGEDNNNVAGLFAGDADDEAGDKDNGRGGDAIVGFFNAGSVADEVDDED
jgi:hypothetical protein